MRIAIIGTAGRKMPVTDYIWKFAVNAMCDVLYELLARHGNNMMPIDLVSGGSAGMDHIAVSLFNINQNGLPPIVNELLLCLPCPFDVDTGRYQDNGVVDFTTNPGGTLNHYHRLFSRNINNNELLTLNDIKMAIQSKSCKILYGNGLFNRNKLIAQNCDIAIALTFNQSNEPDDSGTRDTWNKCIKLGKPTTHIQLPIL
jgi:hypothetical protein